MLNDDQIRQFLALHGFPEVQTITLIKKQNHLYRIEMGAVAGYLKLYTKDWYGDDVAATGYCVDHEMAAWQKLADAGLETPEVLLADVTPDNPLGRPFLLTKQLEGQPFTAINAEADHEQLRDHARVVGKYLSRMHAIRFPFPGYITTTSPARMPQPDEWQHAIWTFKRFQQEATEMWKADRKSVSAVIMDAIEQFFWRHAGGLADDYAELRFVHGDCHANQFFLVSRQAGWQVSGVLDMEVASAGDFGADFLKLFIEMAWEFPVEARWWEALFQGYGSEPDFNRMKLRMLAAHHGNYAWLWTVSRKQILQHVLDAENWYSLLDLTAFKQ